MRGETPRTRRRGRGLARPAGRGAGLERLAPLLDALAQAAEHPPDEAARLLRRAIRRTLGWSAVRSRAAPPLQGSEHAHLDRGEAVIPIAPGAGALRLRVAEPDALLRIGRLAAQ